MLRDCAVVVVFHRVDDRYPDDAITLPVTRFTAMCRFFARRFEVISFGQLVTLLEQRSPLRGQLAITFDDGYRDNHHVAAPILEQFGLPACFFVTSGFIESSEVPWWDQRAGIASEWMSWDEVRDLKRRGFEIGAHTMTHADLGRLSGEEARREIVGSKLTLEACLGGPVDLFAYPFGREAQLTEANRALVVKAGFRCCPSAFGGLVRTGDDPFRFRRLPVTGWYRAPGELGLEVLRASRAG
ncbi:MAG TPA: polysaccharide deacetylase family protein [Gemmatimonadales bacterium]|jgi:peptidoglycan/xylan/chitin deacetylase (PgdA/CDA1 family)|nr:polysaccharide deacetylase family protein [Gemmatimonadales bacterium]